MPASLVKQFQGRRQVKIVGWTHGNRGVHPSDSQGAAFPSPFFSFFLTLLPSPIFSAPKIWNSLPANIRDSPSLPTFRRHLKTHYF